VTREIRANRRSVTSPVAPRLPFPYTHCPRIRNRVLQRPPFLHPVFRFPSPFVKIPRKTIRYECVGGPRDGDVVLIQRTKHNVELDGALYEVRLWAKMDEHGQRLLWRREALVWEGLLTSDAKHQPAAEPPPPQPVDWHPQDG
jgi:hypothetical protein